MANSIVEKDGYYIEMKPMTLRKRKKMTLTLYRASQGTADEQEILDVFDDFYDNTVVCEYEGEPFDVLDVPEEILAEFSNTNLPDQRRRR